MSSCLPRFMVILVFSSTFLMAQAEGAPWWDAKVADAIKRSGARSEEWAQALTEAPVSHRKGLAFLLTHMPKRDLESLSIAKLLDETALCYSVRAQVPYGQQIPEQIWLNNVLPYCHLNEARAPIRRRLSRRFLALVKECKTPGAAALKLNASIFKALGIKYSTARKRPDQNSLATINSGLASCTGLSVLLADTARACGIPARLVGIHTWPTKRGNHTWVEVWDQGWHFLGAAEPDARGLNHTWFQRDASHAISGSRKNGIWAASYATTPDLFPVVWSPKQDYIYSVDVSHRYHHSLPDPKRTRIMVDVRNQQNQRIPARVGLEASDQPTLSGIARDEEADTNDYLTFEVARNHTYTIRVGTEVRQVEADGDQQIVRIKLGSSPAPSSVLNDPAEARRKLWNEFLKSPKHAKLKQEFDRKQVSTTDRLSPWKVKMVGTKPKNGWPLVIAMHGGGGAPKHINDSQWKHMARFYRDHPKVSGYRYLALRAPNDTWNGFYDDAICPLIIRLIEQQVLFADVDPNRVHAIGYSHGGYGAFVIATKIPDRFAAAHASASAPTDGETKLANLFALPFSFMCGERDIAYGRFTRCVSAGATLKKLKEASEGKLYPARWQPITNKGHGGLPDRDKLKEMLPIIRAPLPRTLVWEPSDTVLKNYYWLSNDKPKDGQRIEASIDGNTITLRAKGVESVDLWLDERMIDLKRPITIMQGGESRKFTAVPSIDHMRESLKRWRDRERIFSTKLTLKLR